MNDSHGTREIRVERLEGGEFNRDAVIGRARKGGVIAAAIAAMILRFLRAWCRRKRQVPQGALAFMVVMTGTGFLWPMLQGGAAEARITRTLPDGTVVTQTRRMEAVDVAATEDARRAELAAVASDPSVRAALDATEEASGPDAYAPRPSGPGCADVPGLSAPVLALCDTIDAAGTEMQLDPRVLAVLVEAECPYESDARCVSHAGAFGRAQLMPETARLLAMQTGLACETSQYDHFTNLRCGARYYLDGLISASALWRDGRELSALLAAAAGYNSGHGNVPAAVSCVNAGTELASCWALPEETRRYVAKWRPLLVAAGYWDAPAVAVGP